MRRERAEFEAVATLAYIARFDHWPVVRVDGTADSTCHCGEPVVYGENSKRHRGMCAHCDAVRCDAYPGACGR